MHWTKLLSACLSVLLSLSVGLGTASAESPRPESQYQAVIEREPCVGRGSDEQIQALATLIVNERVSDEVRRCYEDLGDEGKAQVFEAMATLRGISVKELQEEALQDMLARATQPLAAPGDWLQPLERAWLAPVPVVSVSDAWWSGTTCDSDPDIDYIFLFQFSSPVNDPDAVRSFSQHLGVDAMLLWYQLSYGGITGFGNVSTPRVYACIGDSGVAAAGGFSTVYNNLKLFR